MISDMVEEYENVHYPIGKPSLVEVMKLRMYERGLSIENLSNLLGIAQNTINDLFLGNYEPSIKDGKKISQQLSIDPAVVLGV